MVVDARSTWAHLKLLADGTVEIGIIRPPTIYLDQDSLSDLARTRTRQARFLEIWKNKGELLFSFTNAVDLSRPQGDMADYIRDFLEALARPVLVPH
jgi:hypothetical protein